MRQTILTLVDSCGRIYDTLHELSSARTILFRDLLETWKRSHDSKNSDRTVKLEAFPKREGALSTYAYWASHLTNNLSLYPHQ
ncbi:MAG: hypothetical protein V7L21_29975 [Nostoc sp.]|uniref:hypothetical protein n=1 Tax=Nostoc sp. TaxID=1180 RepID=UPI002FF77027